MIVRCRTLFNGARFLDDAVVELDGVAVQRVRRPRKGDPDPVDGVVMPGLVNAHLHLELSGLHAQVPGGKGLAAWVTDLLDKRDDAPPADLAAIARGIYDAGTALVSDVSSDGATAEILADAGLSGVVQHEHLGLARSRLGSQLGSIAKAHRVVTRGDAEIEVRAAPHALYSTAPTVIRACVEAPGRAPSSIHLGEDPDERRFLRERAGPFAELLDRRGVDWKWWDPPAAELVDALDAIGVVGPDLLVVHGVHLTHRERHRLARSGATLVLCPRSNRHIGRLVPELPLLLRSGMRLALGTDSLASAPDLDVLGEVATLGRAFRNVPTEALLGAATWGGAKALRARHLGRVDRGATPGLLRIACDGPGALRAGELGPREWLVPPRGRAPDPEVAS